MPGSLRYVGCMIFGWLLWGGGIEAGVSLDYGVIYRGVFSMGRDMPIADVSLQTRSSDATPQLREYSLEASSAAYPLVESLFPLRYRFRTWALGGIGNVIGFETFEKTRKLRHRLYLRDIAGGFSRHDPDAGDAADAIARMRAGRLPEQIPAEALARSPLTRLLFDRLGLLQHVRQRPLHDGVTFSLPASNGRDPMRYHVRVEAAQTLALHGRQLAAWKLRFDGFDIERDGVERPAHRSVFVWLSRDADRIPLRVDSRHAIGLFRVELKDPVGLVAGERLNRRSGEGG